MQSCADPQHLQRIVNVRFQSQEKGSSRQQVAMPKCGMRVFEYLKVCCNSPNEGERIPNIVRLLNKDMSSPSLPIIVSQSKDVASNHQ